MYVLHPSNVPEGQSFAAYQTEIDHLTRRTKTSETVFLNVYKILAEAPDPYPLLDAAVVRPSSTGMSGPFTSAAGPNGKGLRGSGPRG